MDRLCSIVIPVYNRADLTRQCLAALFENTRDLPFEVIVVDNGSTDETPRLLDACREKVTAIRNADNRGFGGACNQGARAAGAPYVVFLNNDTIPQPGWLAGLADAAARRPNAAVVGCRLLYGGGSVIQHAGVVFTKHDAPWNLYRGFPALDILGARERQFQAVTAACMLVRKGIFRDLGGFDGCFVNGYEDVDICLRARQQGFEVWYTPASVVIHLESMSPGRFERENDNLVAFRTKWGGRVDQDLARKMLEDGFKVIDPKPRCMKILKGRYLFSRKHGVLQGVTELSRLGAVRLVQRVYLAAAPRHVWHRMRYGEDLRRGLVYMAAAEMPRRHEEETGARVESEAVPRGESAARASEMPCGGAGCAEQPGEQPGGRVGSTGSR